MKRLSVVLVLIALLVGLPAMASETQKKTQKQTICPICKMKINKDLYVDYQGKRVYFGCAGCPDQFKANPDKYMKQMKEAGVELYDAPESDQSKKDDAASSDNANNQKMKMHQDKMHNADMKDMHQQHGEMMKDGESSSSHMDKMDNGKHMMHKQMAEGQHSDSMAMAGQHHVQSKCTCGMKHLDFSIYADVDGKRVYFCNANCKEQFMEHPHKNLMKYQKQGMTFEDAPEQEKEQK